MSLYGVHGCYIDNFAGRGAKLVGPLTEAAARLLLARSEFPLPPESVNDGNPLMMNKGFAIVERERGDVMIVVNGDNTFYLYRAPAALFAEHLAR